MQGSKKPDEKPPGDAPPSASSLGAPSSSQKPPEAKKDDPKKFEEFHILAPGKNLQCAAGLVKSGEEVTAAGLGQARFDRLKTAGTIVAKKRRIK